MSKPGPHIATLYPRVAYGEPVPHLVWLEDETADAYVVRRLSGGDFDAKMPVERRPKTDWVRDAAQVQRIVVEPEPEYHNPYDPFGSYP